MDESLTRYLRSLSDREIPVGLSDVERLMKDYPFFTLPALTLMQREGSAIPAETRRRLLGHIALNAPDVASFVALADADRDTWADFYPAEQPKSVTTDNVIDTFLATYGHSSPEEDAMLERLIFNPTADYSALLANEEETSMPEQPDAADDSQDALINSFILKHRHPSTPESSSSPSESPSPSDADTSSPLSPAPVETPGHVDLPTSPSEPPSEPVETPLEVAVPTDHPVAVTESPADTSLSESLAKIYIRRRRYDKAFEIIHGLSLNNPKKSVYFADQLRFLRKLMLNSSYNEQNKPS